MSVAIDYTSGAFAATKAQSVGTITGSDVDLSSGQYFEYTPAADTTFTFSNAPASGTAAGFALAVTGANVTSGYDLANASYDSVSFSVAAQESLSAGVTFKLDGTKMYVIGELSDRIHEYNLSTAWDISTAAIFQNVSVAAQETTPQGLFFSPDGMHLYIIGEGGRDVNQYSVGTAWDVSTISFVRVLNTSPQEFTPQGLFFSPDGIYLYVIGRAAPQDVNQYTLSSAWDISTASFTRGFSVSGQDTSPQDVFFAPTGLKMYVIGRTGDDVNEYSLSTAWDISTASYIQNFSVAAQDINPTGLFFKADGSKMYMVGYSTNAVYQYSTTGTSAPATFNYPTSVDWPSGTAPDAPAVGETDVLVFYTEDGGTTYYGFQAGDAMA